MQLSKNTCELAIVKSLSNAEGLMTDADLLDKHSRISRAYTLYHLAVEELSKASKCLLIYNFNDFENKKSLKSLNILFKDHVTKLQKSAEIEMWLVESLIDSNPKAAREIFEQILENKKKANLFDKLKNYSLYTTYINNTFKNPEEQIKKEHVAFVKQLANVRFNLMSSFWNFTKANSDEILKQDFKNKKINKGEVIKEYVEKLLK
tara:strand:+ start:2521 stop:3138 length:618 start_codon:yes stop_codon:yes gene_type:complete